MILTVYIVRAGEKGHACNGLEDYVNERDNSEDPDVDGG
jgi:hypothetical protein